MFTPDRSAKPPQTCLSAKAATGVGTNINVADFRHVLVQLSAALNSSLTVKFQASCSVDAPDFSAAQSGTNHWDYIAAYDLQDPSSIIVGDTGVALNNASVAANTRQYVVNTDFMRWFNMEVTSYTDGDVTSVVTGCTI